MNNKDLALNEFYEGLLKKYIPSPNIQHLIHSKMSTLKKKPKISINDLNDFEESLRTQMHSSFKSSSPATSLHSSVNESFKLSPGHPYPSERSLSSQQSKINSRLLFKQTGKKQVSKYPDNTIFPKEDNAQYNPNGIWKKYQNFSPLIKNLDVWGQICKADYLKYQAELKEKQTMKKIKQNEYKAYLENQIELEHAKKIKKIVGDEVTNSEANIDKELEKSKAVEIKRSLEEMIKNKQEKIRKEIIEKNEEGIKLKNTLEQENLKEKQKLIEKNRKKKEFSFELLTQTDTKKIKRLNEINESQRKSKELLEQRINFIDSNEKLKRNFILEKIKNTHDDEKLSKLLPIRTKAFKFSENLDHSIGSLENNPKDRVKMREYSLVLQRQMQEKREKELSLRSFIEEQGTIWRENDEKAHFDDKIRKLKIKERQKQIKQDLDNQVTQKITKQINELMFTDDEAKINKKIFESSLLILENKNL